MASALSMLVDLKEKFNGKEDHQECKTLQVDMAAPVSVDIEFKNLTLKVSTGLRKRNKKTILKGISGNFKSGQLTAIMGPSGAGKSSLLNALTGFSTSGVTGTIRAGDSECIFGNNRNALKSLKAYRKKSCYILQDDRLNPLFTVAELMKFAADLKLGDTLTDKLKNTVINDVLNTLGLSGTEETRCENLSGGQKKRLSIAVELIDNPPVVFLDEPTTGLDSLTSGQCIDLLKKLAREGRTVVCTIHQPSASVYNMFDHVYVLADGQCVYNGSSENTVPYLASVGLQCPMYHNPADYLLEVANGEYGNFTETLSAVCNKEDWTKEPVILSTSSTNITGFSCGKTTMTINRPSEFYKFKILYKRCLMQMYRDWTVTHLKVVLHFFIGVVMGLLYEKAGYDGSKTVSNISFLIISPSYLTYTSLMPAVLRFPQELPVLKKENFNNWYYLRTYYAAVLVSGIPIQVLYSVVYAIPAYFLSGQPPELYRFVMFVLVLGIITILADAIGNVIGTCVNPINGTFFGAITTCTAILFAGFVVFLSHMSKVMRIVSYASFLRHSYEALVVTVYAYGRKPLFCPDEKIYCHLRMPEEIINLLSFKYDNYWTDVLILLVEVVIVRIIAFYTLRRCMRKSTH